MAVLECTCHPMAPIHVLATIQLHVTFPTRPMNMCCSKQEAKLVYNKLINLQDKKCDNPDRQDNDIGCVAINTPDSQTMARLEATSNTVNQDIGQDNCPKRNKRDLYHINDPHKSKGFIALQPTLRLFSFIDPDRQATDTSGVDKYLEMAMIIKKSGLSNYRQARIPLSSGLNIDAWKRYLHNYPDQKLVQYLQYGFPLSVKSHSDLVINQDIGQDNCPKRNKRDLYHINDPHKSKGFIALQPTLRLFSFIDPDRQATDTSGVDKYLEMAMIIKKSGLSNYRQARIPLSSGLNIDAWKRYLHNYPDQKLVQYLQYGFPLSIKSHSDLKNQNVKNHYSALQFPHAVEQYLSKELSEGAIIGPIKQFGQNPGHKHIHFSPLLTRPKDKHKR